MKLPMETIDRLFKCMKQFYGERWSAQFKNIHDEAIHKTIWQSGLYGCSEEEIRAVLVYLKRAAQNPNTKPPHQIEFYHYAKGHKVPYIEYQAPVKQGNRAMAMAALDEINAKIKYRKRLYVEHANT